VTQKRRFTESSLQFEHHDLGPGVDADGRVALAYAR
jgi:hypothetical protein